MKGMDIKSALVDIFERKVTDSKVTGKFEPLTSTVLRNILANKYDVRVDGRGLRGVLKDLRYTGQIDCLVGDSKGYYVSSSPEDLLRYSEVLQHRIDGIAHLKQVVLKQMRELKK